LKKEIKVKKIWVLVTTLFLAVALMAGCAGLPANQIANTSGEGPNIGESSNFRLLISDEVNAIDQFVSLNATVTSIGYLQAGESSEWEEQDIPDATVDLVQLPGLNAIEVWNGYLISGNYTKVFIYVSDVEGTLKNGDQPNVKLPGGKFQISKPFEVPAGGMVNFVFDLTAIEAGNSGQYILRPQVGESGADKEFKEVTAHGQAKETGKPGSVGKPEGVGKPENAGKPTSEVGEEDQGT
jgi:hypothetical protein